MRLQRQRLRAHRTARGDHDARAGQHRQQRRAAGGQREFFKPGLGEGLNAHGIEVHRADLQHGRPQQELPAVAGHVAQLFEGIEAPASRGGRQTGTRGNLAQRHVRLCAREGAQDFQALGEASHDFASSRRRDILLRHIHFALHTPESPFAGSVDT
jgi:hypothetical protein